MTPPVAQKKEMSPHRRNDDYDKPKTKIVTPEDHIDFMRNVFDSARSRESLKDKGLSVRSERTANRILLPVLDELPGSQRHQPGISLRMRRNIDNLQGLDFVGGSNDLVTRDEDQYNESTPIETQKVISSASGVWYEPMRSVKTLARSNTATDIYMDEWKLLQEAKQKIASVKEFLRVHSLQPRETEDDNDVQDVGIETLLLQDNHVALIEESPVHAQIVKRDTRFPRRTSFGEKPPRPPQSPKEYSRSSTGLNQDIAEF
jgi:hypothetical protein